VKGQLVQFGAVTYVTVTVAKDGTESEAIDLDNNRLAGIVMPAQWSAANITFQTSVDGTNFVDLYDTSATPAKPIINSPAAATAYFLTEAMRHIFAGVRYLKLVSSQAQAAARSITLVVRPSA
jgi:hypothetical protein